MRENDFINVLESFKGIREEPDGSNRTPLGEEYGWNGVPWCAIALSVACRRLGFPLHTAAVIQIEKHARAGDWGMRWSPTPVRGAATIFDWEGRGNPNDMHTGGVKEVLEGNRFRDLEGNYRNRFDEVLRDMTYVRGFAVFPFEDVPAPSQPSPAPQPPAPAPLPPPDQRPFGDWPEQENKPMIRRGSRGNPVAYLQQVISAKAGGHIGIDGIFGPQTEGRVRTVQLNNHIGVDGIVGPQTWGVIDHLARS